MFGSDAVKKCNDTVKLAFETGFNQGQLDGMKRCVEIAQKVGDAQKANVKMGIESGPGLTSFLIRNIIGQAMKELEGDKNVD